MNAMSSIKYLLFAFASMYLLMTGTTALIDVIADSSKQPASSQSAEEETQSEIAQILAGADPTDVFEPTAAGRMLTPECFSGQIETANQQLSSLNGTRFISRNFQGETYITLMTLPPVYLLQDEHQAVSATRIDNLPPELRAEMGVFSSKSSSCPERSLYLSKIN